MPTCDSSYYYSVHVKWTSEKLSFLFLMPKDSALWMEISEGSCFSFFFLFNWVQLRHNVTLVGVQHSNSAFLCASAVLTTVAPIYPQRTPAVSLGTFPALCPSSLWFSHSTARSLGLLPPSNNFPHPPPISLPATISLLRL